MLRLKSAEREHRRKQMPSAISEPEQNIAHWAPKIKKCTRVLIAIRESKLVETKGKRQTHPDVFIMESYNEDQETPSGQADGTIDDQGDVGAL